MNVFRGAHRRVPRRTMFAATAAITAVALTAGVAIWISGRQADAATVQPGAFTGYGFDACTAPSSDTMKTWMRSSPYRAVGIYFGGVSRGCSQPNLTPAWVDEQQAAGWHLIPIYVGPQAACTTKTHKIDNATASSQGRLTAADAVVQAAKLHLARNSMLIYDMEAYNSSDAACKAGVLAFMNAWTIRLHEYGYASGYYSSTGSGIADVTAKYNTPGFVVPDYIDFARWDNVVTVGESTVPATYWTPRRRIKQYLGGHTETWGGVTINIDNDYLDVAPPATTAMADYAGNGWSDVVARSSSGALSLYPGHGHTVETTARSLGTGWNSMNAIIRIGDLNRDGHEDFVARQKSNGALWFYPGTGTGIGKRKQIGSGWGTLRELTAIGDFTGDGYPDLMAITKANQLWIYPGRSGVKLGAKLQVGTGWGALAELAGVGDFDKNGHPDFVARVTSKGTLNFYGGRSGGFSGKQIGTGWGGVRDLVGLGDFDRDGYPDLGAVRNSDGALLLYRGKATRFQSTSTLATGFGSRSPVL
jgi:hypothetical protein